MRRWHRSLGALALTACRFDPAYRDDPIVVTQTCVDGEIACHGTALTRCDANVLVTVDDCAAKSQVCAPTLVACAPCVPLERTCDGANVLACNPDGQARSTVATCDGDTGIACRSGACTDLCGLAAQNRSNIGCEYWPVDLDNAVVSTGNAAAQQYAVIVSNPQPDVAAKIVIEQDDAPLGQPAQLRTVATASVGVHHLEVFKLGPREVDGSPPDQPNGGTGTALSRQAYRLRSNVPIVAFQFNPLDNVNVFSNDASLLLPTAALNSSGLAYVVAGWPQTIAQTSNPDTNFGDNLRAFLTIVGTAPDTKIHLKTTTRVIAGGPFNAGIAQNGEVDATLQPFEVLNLETGDFNADFTGSTISSTGPVVVYSGSEASDAPYFQSLAARACCADHLESQVTPLRAVGRHYVVGRMPNRSRAIAAAGGAIQPFAEPELYRVVSVGTDKATVKTTLPAPYDVFELAAQGESMTIPALQDFELTSDRPVLLADVQVSQEAAGVVRGLPGGDPSLLFVPPVEQWRNDYILLTPDKYAFDFLVITAPAQATVYLDGLVVDGKVCETATNGAYTEYRCQLSFPVVDPNATSPNNVLPGEQNDGVHRVQADYPLGVLVYGFDSFVSYAYAGGTELIDTNLK